MSVCRDHEASCSRLAIGKIWSAGRRSERSIKRAKCARDERAGTAAPRLFASEQVRKYLIVGARACWLHGYVRATSDVAILIPEDLENHERIIAALSELEDRAAAELTPQDFVDNIVVKIADEIEVDVSTRAWKVTYDEAQKSGLHRAIEGVDVPHLDLPTLIEKQDHPTGRRTRSTSNASAPFCETAVRHPRHSDFRTASGLGPRFPLPS